jgi:hypothetical protein
MVKKHSLSRNSNAASITITSGRECVSATIAGLIVTFAVDHASNLPLPAFRSKAFRPKTYVEVVAQDIHCCTQSVRWEKDRFT